MTTDNDALPKAVRDALKWAFGIIQKYFMKSVVLGLVACMGWVFAQGKAAVKAAGSDIAVEAVKPVLDSFKVEVDTLKHAVKALEAQVGDLRVQQEKDRLIQNNFFGAMMQVIPGLKSEVRKLGDQNINASLKKVENDTLLENLSEIKP